MRALPSRRIFICADDYGISPGVNRAIRDLIVHRRINATSVMVAAPSLQRSEIAALIDVAANRAAIGLHLTLTAPFKPLSRDFAPMRDGAFLPIAATLHRALWRGFTPKLLTSEIVRQFEAFNAAFGRAPSFVDGHQHVQLFPQIRDALLRVVKDAAPDAWVRQCGRSVAAYKRLSAPKALLLDALSRRFRRRADDLGVPTNPAFAGAYMFRTDADFSRLFPEFINGMPGGGVIMCHPGLVDDELKALDPLIHLREREYAFFKDDSFPGLLAAHGVTL